MLEIIGYIVPAIVIGWAWARFMPRWNMEDRREHTVECLAKQKGDDDGLYDYFGSRWLCDCPVRHGKTDAERERDFLLAGIAWPVSMPLVTIFVSCWALIKSLEWLFNWMNNNLRDTFRAFLRWP